MSRTLYDIAYDYNAFLAAMDDYVDAVEAGEIPADAIADTINAIEGELDEKLDNVACVIKNHNALLASLRAEKQALDKRIKAHTAAVDRLRAYVESAMRSVGKSKLETPRNVLSFRRSYGVRIESESDFIAWAQSERPDLLTYKAPTVSLTAVGDAIKAGEDIAGAVIEERYNLQIK